MQRRSWLIAAALLGGLIVGMVFGPQLRGTSASAQTQTPTQTPAPAQSAPAQGQSAAPRAALLSQFLDNLAAALNIQRSALDSAITSAGTTTADQAVQQGTLTQAQADNLKGRVQSGDLGALFGGRGGKGIGGARVPGVREAMLDAAAQALNITSDELTTQLRSGQTLAQLAAAHNTTEQAVTDAALAAAKTQLDQAVAAGTLTQAQADSFYSQLQQQGAQLLRGGKGGHGGRRGPGGSTTPQDPAAPSASPAPSGTEG